MYTKPASRTNQQSLFFDLESQLNQKHPLYLLANKIDWNVFEEAFKGLYCANNGRPAKPIRRMVGLMILKHVRNVSDESVVEQWQENIYYQYFCGEQSIQTSAPCTPTELVEFRKRIGEEGVELILKESIRVNDDHDDIDKSFIDSTVQEKNVTFPTDAKLTKKIISRCLKINAKLSLPLRQNYKREMKGLSRDQRFRNHPKNRRKAQKADRRMKTIAGRLVRELERNLLKEGLLGEFAEEIALYYKVLAQKKDDKDKTYSLHEPEVECISKGKEHKKYEFGNNTIDRSLEQVERLAGQRPKLLASDRGYRGQKQSDTTKIMIPDVPKAGDSYYMKRKKHKLFCKRAGIEPVIGHLKADHRLCRNFYAGVFGDNINVMLAAAGFNFKRAMRIFYAMLRRLLPQIQNIILQKPNLLLRVWKPATTVPVWAF